jgi:hypothetical protein
MRGWAALPLVFFGCSRSSPEPPPHDESPPEATAKEREKEPAAAPLHRDDREAVRKAHEAATGTDLGEGICAVWPNDFSRIVVVGSFANDRGCMTEGLFVDGAWYDGRRADAVTAGLATRGWIGASSDERQRLARGWVDAVVHAFGGSFVEEATTAFGFDDTPAFEPVRVRAHEGTGVMVSGWVAKPPGMLWEDAYAFIEYAFDDDAVLRRTVSREFAVAGDRIQAAERDTGSSAPVPAPVRPAPTRPAPTAPARATPASPAPASAPAHRSPH